MISRARLKASMNGGVRRLSGGELNVKRYTFGAGWVTTNDPSGAVCVDDLYAGTGIVNIGGIGAMLSCCWL
jgi:hypothetical protein